MGWFKGQEKKQKTPKIQMKKIHPETLYHSLGGDLSLVGCILPKRVMMTMPHDGVTDVFPDHKILVK